MGEMNYNRQVSSGGGTGVLDFNVSGISNLYTGKSVSASRASTSSGTTSSSLDLSTFLTDNIDETVTQEKIADPKPYASEPGFGEKVLDFLGKAACDVGGFTLGLVDGVLEFGEGLVDAAMIIGTAAVTISNPIFFTDLIIDGVASLAGIEYKGITETMWADVVMPAVGYDISGAAMDGIYSLDWIDTINENAHGPFKRGGGVYKIGKTVGTTVGTIALAVATGGTSIPLTVSTTSAILAGSQKMGNSIEKSYNSLEDDEKKDMGNIFAINANGMFKGLIEGGTWYLTYGNGLGKVGKYLDGTKLGAVFSSSGKSWFKFLTDKSTKILGLTQQSWVKGGLQATKTYANWGVDLLTIGSNETFGEVTWDAVVNAAISMFYDNTNFAKNWFNKGKNALTQKYTIPEGDGTVDMKTDLGDVDASATTESLEEVLKSTGANYKLTHEGSIIIEAYNKTGGTLIKKFETFFLEEFVGGITPYLKRVFGGA